MTYLFQYFNIFPDRPGKTTFYSSRRMDGNVWSFEIAGNGSRKPAFIALPIVGWKVKSLKLKGWKIKHSHQIIDHKK